MTSPTPKLRKPFGVLLMIALLAIYALLAARLAEPITALPILLQLPIWIVLGVAWIFPMKPLILWIETGRWKVR